METVMSWGAEEWQGARPGQVREGEEGGWAERLGWRGSAGALVPPQQAAKLPENGEGACPAQKLPAINGESWAAGLSREEGGGRAGGQCAWLLRLKCWRMELWGGGGEVGVVAAAPCASPPWRGSKLN